MNNLPDRRVLMSIVLSFTLVLTGSHARKVCKTDGGNDVNKPCVFPFIYKSVVYDVCTERDREKYWCFTDVDSNGFGVSGKWGYCGDFCSVEWPPATYEPETTDLEEPTKNRGPKGCCITKDSHDHDGDMCIGYCILPYVCCPFSDRTNTCTLKENCPPLEKQFTITFSDLESEESEEISEEIALTTTESELTTIESETTATKTCKDNDEEIRRLTYGVYKSCWLMVLSNSGKCRNSGEGIATYAENCRLSCGQCKKDPKDMDIVDIIHSHENLSTLAFAIANAHFIPLLRSTKENFTLFAPHNDAFDEDLINMITSNETGTFDLLYRHKVVGHGRYTTDKIDRGVMITLNNYGKGTIEIWRNGTTDAITVVERPGNNPFATMVERDIHASNGVIHILDGIL